MGEREKAATDRACAVEGNANRHDQRTATREDQRETAATASIIGVLAADSDLNAPIRVYGAENAIGSDPKGRVTTRFVIAPTGGVVAATIANSSLDHAATESCLRNVVRRVTFPAVPRGGVVSVNYPFTFSAAPR